MESTHVTFVPQGNPIFDLQRRDAMAEITGYLDQVGVLLAGRYAEWKYLMTDACVISARRAAAVLSGPTAASTTPGSRSAARAEDRSCHGFGPPIGEPASRLAFWYGGQRLRDCFTVQ